jgi:hypothetical protein
MTFLLNGFHPSFESLSSLADASDVDAARTRVGRHVARCAKCSREVGEIRAMGEGARAAALPGAPGDLWAKIERARADGPTLEHGLESLVRPMVTTRRAVSLRSLSARGLRLGLLGAAAAGIVAVVLLLPFSRGGRLEAGASTGRWRFTPERPTPGATVAVRYEPRAGSFDAPALLLLGGMPHRADNLPGNPYRGDGLEDSLALLRRQSDGTYAGEFRFPASALTMIVHLTNVDGRPRPRIMSTSGVISRTPEEAALLVAGDERGAPSLSALTEATELWPGNATVAYAVSDTLIHYFPNEPIGYATDRRRASGRVIDDLIAWFKRGERSYVRFDSRFERARNVSADHEIAMITFAHRIDEPGEVRKWTMRLVRDHPEDARALVFYSSLLGDMLSRNGTVDSVRRGLSLADSLWERNGHRSAGLGTADVAGRVGDHEAERRWWRRAVLSGARDYQGGILEFDEVPLEDPAIRSTLQARFRDRVSTPCTIPSGKHARWGGTHEWEQRCSSGRISAYATLSYLARIDGRIRAAVALADSSVTLSDSTGMCWSSTGRRRKGEALLALGDTAKAIPELAAGLGYTNWESIARRDSLGATLSRFIATDSWNREVASADARTRECVVDRTRRLREMKASEHGSSGL